MKKMIIGMALCGVFSAGYAQQKCIVSGHIEGVKTDTLIAMIINDEFTKMDKMDTIPMKNGDFSYEFPVKALTQISIASKPTSGHKMFEEDKSYISLFLIPRGNAIINGSLDNYKISGDTYYKQYYEVKKLMADCQRESLKLQEDAYNAMENGASRDSVIADYNTKQKTITDKIGDLAKKYIISHPGNSINGYVSLFLKNEDANIFPEEKMKNDVMLPYVNAMKLNKEKAKKREEASKKISEGKDAPDFTLNDINGKPLSLASLRGKYVVLDFWGSWCGWCVKGFPDMKIAYFKYKNKVEFLGIDCNDKEDKWKDAVKKHELPWIHVRNVKNNDITVLYAIKGYPSKIIIDPNGKIVKVFEGEDPAFYNFLDDLLK